LAKRFEIPKIDVDVIIIKLVGDGYLSRRQRDGLYQVFDEKTKIRKIKYQEKLLLARREYSISDYASRRRENERREHENDLRNTEAILKDYDWYMRHGGSFPPDTRQKILLEKIRRLENQNQNGLESRPEDVSRIAKLGEEVECLS